MRALLSTLALVLAPLPAAALFHLWQVTQVYSNANGVVQYVVLSTNSDSQNQLNGHTLASTSTTFTFRSNLASSTTSNHSLLIATPQFVNEPGAVAPDFTFPAANFMSNVADTINFAGVDTLVFTSGQLPTDGANALYEDFGDGSRHTGANTPTNFAGQVGPEPAGWLGLLAGSAAVFALGRHPRPGGARAGSTGQRHPLDRGR